MKKINFIALMLFLPIITNLIAHKVLEEQQVLDISDLTQEKDEISILLNKLHAKKTQFLMLTFVDILGNLKEVIIPIDQAENALKHGVTFDGSSIAGYKAIKQSDMLIKPDLSTLRFLPWLDEPQQTACLMSNVFINNKQPYETDSRLILQNACDELKELGYKFNVGVELEFFLLEKDKKIASDNQGYFDVEEFYVHQQEKHVFLHILKGLNIDSEKLHHEVAPGQNEISIKYNNPLKIADDIIMAKYALKLIAKHIGYHITFMPKPVEGQNGSGMHIHYSLVNLDKKRNVFYEENEQNSLSTTAKNFLAGNMEYIKELAALFNPTINSYKRLIPGFEAPIFVTWAPLNRSAMFRIPLINSEAKDGMRIEFRCPDAMCNPYLALAALIKSGIEGIKNNKKLTAPTQQNLYKLSKPELQQLNIPIYPTNLAKALNNFKKSQMAQNLLGKKGFDTFLKIKKRECLEFNKAVTSWEIAKYL